MSINKINDNKKSDVTLISNNLKLSLSDKSYICEYGHLHNYSKINFKEMEDEANNNKTYNNVAELMKEIEEE